MEFPQEWGNRMARLTLLWGGCPFPNGRPGGTQLLGWDLVKIARL